MKVGDRILLGRCSGNQIKLDGADCLITKEPDVMGASQDEAAAAIPG